VPAEQHCGWQGGWWPRMVEVMLPLGMLVLACCRYTAARAARLRHVHCMACLACQADALL
jgi:hypothetical protein